MKLRTLILCFLALTISTEIFSQDSPAILDLESTEKGFLPPRMNTTQRDNIVGPSDGLIIFNTSTGNLNYYDEVIGVWNALQPIPTPAPNVTPTQTICVGANSFKGTRSTDETSSGYGQGGAYLTSPAYAKMTAGVQIPVGSTITSITFYYKDNDPSTEISFRIHREDLTFGAFSDVINTATGVADASDSWQSTTLSVSHTVQNQYGYYIDAFSSGWSNLLVVKGACVTYTLPTN